MRSCGRSQLIAVGLDRADAGVCDEEVGAEGSEKGRDVRNQLLNACHAAVAPVAVESVPFHGCCLPTFIPENAVR